MTEPLPPGPPTGETTGAIVMEVGAGGSLEGPGTVAHETGEPEEKSGKKPRSALRSAVEWIVVIGGAVLVALVVKTFLFQAFYIPSPSMSPTLVQNDRVLVNKLAYHFHDVHRGDVVVFERPPTEPTEDIKDLIKRVIGLPGDRVSIMGDRVNINGHQITEPYVHGLPTTYASCGLGKVDGIDTKGGLLVPKGTVFVMGDNRTDSHDGRCFGPIKKSLIVGRAFMIIWPPSKIGTL
ncbi:MAG: signal peptidase I [Actinomycetota bacterium]|nr:signal peptidase I [Actinomycetota bacterium]